MPLQSGAQSHVCRLCITLRLLAVSIFLAAISSAPVTAQDAQAPASSSSQQPSASDLLKTLPSDTVQKLLEDAQGKTTRPIPPAAVASTTTLPATGGAGTHEPAASSKLEVVMSQRAGATLRQFGYDQVGYGRTISVPQVGAIQDDYILGPGDQIHVTLRGQENDEFVVTVDRDGRVILPRLRPISAAGRTFGDFRADLEDAVSHAYISTNVFISLAQLRQLSVMVVGEVHDPGQKTLTGLSTPLDAILIAGGIKKSGSLRNIKLIRNGSAITYDLYDIIAGVGATKDIRLAEGDRIIVNPLGRTVAVAGWVRRPAIYELSPSVGAISARSLLSLAGGLEVGGKYRLSVMRMRNDGQQELEPLQGEGGVIKDGEILFVEPAADQRVGTAILAGEQPMAGLYPISHTARLSELLNRPGALGDSPYTLFGLISRRDPRTYVRSLIAFSPLAILDKSTDITLQNDDIVRVFSTSEAKLLFSTVDDFRAAVALNIEQSKSPGATGSTATVVPLNQGTTATAPLPNDAVLGTPIPTEEIDRTATGETNNPESVAKETGEVKNFGDFAQQLRVSSLVLVSVLIDNEVLVSGAVRSPGTYIVGPGVTLGDLIPATGGTTALANENEIELTNISIDPEKGASTTTRVELAGDSKGLSYVLQPRDRVHFSQIPTIGGGTVRIEGEVSSPGNYSILKGERLSELLVRAGGLTDIAYPYGTVFLRKSVAAQEKVGYGRVADEIQDQLVGGLTAAKLSTETGNTALSADAFAGISVFLTQIRNQVPIGRLSVVADPSVLATHPNKDILLESGDVIYIPQRPSTITVLGEVMQPGSYLFDPNRPASDYITLAGGYGSEADTSHVFVVYPDGTAEPLKQSWMDFDSSAVPPGTVIFVPRELFPVNWASLAIQIGDILKDLAVSIASVAVLSKS